ncbi:MAG: lactate racemase domain-containing protein [Dehalococcoidia bacterium]|nr:lactate racemase domain-containing protein [Dehalococcoidia bacterium]
MPVARNSVMVPQLAWCGDIEAEFAFPDNWEVTACTWPGALVPKISDGDIRRALANPISSPSLRELARGKKNVVILFDDMSRPTKVYDIAPFVLEELSAAGVEDDNIQFICALGCHGALNAIDFRKKLGDNIVARFNVYNHNIYDNCTNIGTTSYGTPVALNTEFVNADLKIGIGCVVPHRTAGFGGGAKIVLPGVASIETIRCNHSRMYGTTATHSGDPNIGYGKVEKNALHLEMDEVCQMSGLDFKIDVLVNQKRDAVAIFAGDPIDQFNVGVKAARQHYCSLKPSCSGMTDVVVVNAYAKTNETYLGVRLGEQLLPESGGTLVFVSNSPYAEVTHYLIGSFGNHMAGPLFRPVRFDRRIRKFILLMPFRCKTGAQMMAPAEAITWAKTWDEVIALLQADYPNGAKVAVVPDGTIQYFD